MANRRILITGGSGRLGSAIRKIVECVAPGHRQMDITDRADCFHMISQLKPDTIIHCAGYVNALEAETHQRECWKVNVEGTANMLRAAAYRRLIYISTDYVFDGRRGNYSEEDIPHPLNFYGLSKLAGEVAVLQYPDTLILRAPFRSDPPWRYERAFEDQWTSCEFVSQRAPDIVKAALSDAQGILHIGGVRRSIFGLARLAGPPTVGRKLLSEQNGVVLPRDVSLNSGKWEALK